MRSNQTIWRRRGLQSGLLALTILAVMAGPGRGAEGGAREKSGGWSFQPATRPAVPPSTAQHPIDAFIRARLEQEGLSPSPEADRATLIRRLNYDLIGLPPTPEEVDAFLADGSLAAYEKLVDRLLASPRHGERWARHWLDVVHFGETHGYDKDKLRPHAWPYRDYVIRSFNADKPYPRFVEEQLAGDELYPDRPDGVIALGFIAAGPWDFVGHVELPESKTDGLIARYNDRDDMVMTTMSTFQSLTVHCARCHDHKFDPIAQRDYYALQAVFAGVDRADRAYDADEATHARRRTIAAEKKSLEARQRELKSALAGLSSPELTRLDRQLAALNARLGNDGKPAFEKQSPSNGYHSSIEPKADTTKWVQIDLGRRVALDQLRLVPARPTDFPDTPGFGFPARFRVEIADDPAFNRAETVAEYAEGDFKNPGDDPFVLNLKDRSACCVRVTATRLWKRTRDYVFALAELQAFADGTNAARQATVTALDSIEAGRWAKQNLVDGYSSRTALRDVTLSSAALARREETGTELHRLTAARQRVFDALIPEENKAESGRLAARLVDLSEILAGLPEPKFVYAAASDFKAEGSFVPPKGLRAVHLLPRGDVKRPQEIMTPAALPAVPGPEAAFNLPDDHREGARRAALAKWLTDPRNLQTRRSIVNRVWQYHFGRGLVETSNDFGHMGSPPTHPALLDWLAFWFLDHGESFKELHKLIVTSTTYRQASQSSASRAQTLDADNRFLWRMSRTRLDAECIRDAMLLASGRLDLTMGGPSDRQFFFKDDHSPVYDYTRFDVDGPGGARRSIYRHLVRSVPDPFMDCLDAADPSQLVARRNTTLTALQALATLNNPFVLRQCERFAERLARAHSGVNEQIESAYKLALSRPPTTSERSHLTTYAEKHGLANACRVLFNSTEFVFVD